MAARAVRATGSIRDSGMTLPGKGDPERKAIGIISVPLESNAFVRAMGIVAVPFIVPAAGYGRICCSQSRYPFGRLRDRRKRSAGARTRDERDPQANSRTDWRHAPADRCETRRKPIGVCAGPSALSTAFESGVRSIRVYGTGELGGRSTLSLSLAMGAETPLITALWTSFFRRTSPRLTLPSITPIFSLCRWKARTC
jgi:hypothetical protein